MVSAEVSVEPLLPTAAADQGTSSLIASLRFARIPTAVFFFENVYDFLLSDPFRSNYNTLYTCSGSLDIDRFSSEKYVFPRFQAAILALYHLQSDRSANPWDRTIGLSVNANIWIICISFARVVDRSGRFLFFSFWKALYSGK